MEGTAQIRESAATWSLAGDRQLLQLLTALHQKITSKCEETNNKLQQMTSALDAASVSLQNVNNRFLSLSACQFIESRVYEDEIDVAHTDTEKKEVPPADPVSHNLTELEQSLTRLEWYHELVHILPDSDSESDSGSDPITESVVLRPKELYERRLPYTIGSKLWREKWHAGLVAEDSDTDSDRSAPHTPAEQYSDDNEEGDGGEDTHLQAWNYEEDLVPAPVLISTPPEEDYRKPQSQSEVAAEVARRLAAGVTILPSSPQSSDPPSPAKRAAPIATAVPALFKAQPHTRVTAAVFNDEPPPLDHVHDHDHDHDDIFADLDDDADIFTKDAKVGIVAAATGAGDAVFGSSAVANPTRPLMEAESVTPDTETAAARASDVVRKPAGAKSLFGDSRAAETIGDAILKRNQSPPQKQRIDMANSRQSTSENQERRVYGTPRKIEDSCKEEDAFADLFASAGRPEVEKPKKHNITDILFDDFDDLFSADIVGKVDVKEHDKTIPGLFDDDDDLFADLDFNTTKTKVTKPQNEVTEKSVTTNKNIFEDSEDDLFKEEQSKKTVKESKKHFSTENKNLPTDKKMLPDLLFDDDDSDGDLFLNISKAGNLKQDSEIKNLNENTQKNNDKDKRVSDDKHHKLLLSDQNISTIQSEISSTSKTDNNKPSLFDNNSIDDVFCVIPEIAKNTRNIYSGLLEETVATCESDGVDKGIPNKNLSKISSLSNNEINKELQNDDLVMGKAENVKDTYNVDNFKVGDTIAAKSNIFVTEKNSNLSPSVVSTPKNLSVEKSFDSKLNITTTPDATKKETDPKQEIVTKPNISDIKKPGISSKLVNSLIEKDSLSRVETYGKPDLSTVEKDTLKTKHITDNSDYNKPSQSQNILKDSKRDINTQETDDISDNNLFFIPPPLPKSEKKNNDAFLEIFNDQPPEFLKPTEPKKSKNINALFDDDSEDEALFFKKNDNIAFEKAVELPAENKENPVFGLFYDEPPDLDFNFEQKMKKTKAATLVANVTHTSVDSDDRGDISKQNESQNKILDESTTLVVGMKDTEDFSDYIFDKHNTISNLSTQKKLERNEHSYNINNTESNKDIADGVPQSKQESKTVGKLKAININIDVNALRPGVSPKKVTPTKKFQEVNTIANDFKEPIDLEVPTEIVKPTLPRSVSFEEDPDSPLLCNKLSKDRAKIQVKRRPSSRRARKEAVRKSVIDVDDYDSTDASNSLEEPIQSPRLKNDEKTENDKIDINTIGKIYSGAEIDIGKENIDEDSDQELFGKKCTHTDIITNESNKTLLATGRGESKILSTDIDYSSKKMEKEEGNVYNDSDGELFGKRSTRADSNKTTNEFNTADLEAAGGKSKLLLTDIHTIGKIYSRTEKEKLKNRELFGEKSTRADWDKINEPNKSDLENRDDDDDDDIFKSFPHKAVKNEEFTENNNKRTSIFDDLSDEELFGGSSIPGPNIHSKKKAEKPLPSLSDNEDLFGSKPTTVAVSDSSAEPKKATKKTQGAHVTFEDPLSAFQDQ